MTDESTKGRAYYVYAVVGREAETLHVRSESAIDCTYEGERVEMVGMLYANDAMTAHERAIEIFI